MVRSFFVAARNSRHRTAALALYRALIRTARQIPLPGDAQHRGPVHPVIHLVRKRFQSHKDYTSLRLVYSSLAAGYKFLTVLTKARNPQSLEKSQVVNLLSKRNQSSTNSRAAAPARVPGREPKAESLPPLVQNIGGPHDPPRYVPNPRPRKSLSRPRRVPTLAADSYQQPFLRYSKPQPKVLNNMVGRKRKIWQLAIERISFAEEEMGPDAALEDLWETHLEQEMRREGLAEPMKNKDASETYLWGAVLSKLWYELRLERIWQDWTARGAAMYELVQAERALAEQENESNEDDLPPLSASLRPQQPKERKPSQGGQQLRQRQPSFPSAAKAKPMAADPMPALSAAAATIAHCRRKRIPLPEDTVDPFTSPIWAGVVARTEGRLKMWMATTPRGDSSFWKDFQAQDRRRYAKLEEERDLPFSSLVRSQSKE